MVAIAVNEMHHQWRHIYAIDDLEFDQLTDALIQV